MDTTRKLTAFAIGLFSAWFADPARAQLSMFLVVHNVVLVHDAWADSSSWSELITRLRAAGLEVTALQNPPNRPADSDTAVHRASRGSIIRYGFKYPIYCAGL